MCFRALLGLFCLLAAGSVPAQVLIKNVNVLDVENKKLLAGYNVVALDGRIVSIDKDRMYKLPDGTQVIDGTGKYLVPGFTDAHVHFFQSAGLYARPDAIDLRKYRPYSEEVKWVHDHMEDFLRRYSRAGITSVVDVGATVNFLKQRDSFRLKPYAPSIVMTGPLLTTYIPEPYKNLGDDSPFIEMKSEEGVRRSVRDMLAQKADFIKIWYIVLDTNIENGARKNYALVQAAIDEAHKNKLRVAVHATERITAQLAVEAGADFLVHNVEDEVVSNDFVNLLAKNKVVLSPTLVVAGNYGKVLGDTYHFTTEELDLAHPVTIGSIFDYPWPDTALASIYVRNIAGPRYQARRAADDSIVRINLQKLYNGGVTIATGTDAGNTGTQHASSYFDELRSMQAAGMSGWDLLVASTLNGAKAVGQQDSLGSLAKGKIANMVLLEANPLDSLANWRRIDWVINKGVAFRPDSLLVTTPAMLAQQQLNAYNAHDLDAFLAPYSEEVEVYAFPSGKQLIKGKEKMRQAYTFITNAPGLYCRLLNRIVQGNTVIDHEEIWSTGNKPIYGIAIYVVENDRISKVYFPE
ncbi:MAG: amidohydrolase family protein [Chitinophagaceae bacterium]